MTTYRIVFECQDNIALSKKVLKELMEMYGTNTHLSKLTWEIVGLSEEPIQ